LAGLGMRVTYRTLRVLAAVVALGGRGSGPSNREIADHAGISDEGQISKLLARLKRVGLIENSGVGHAKGEPNAWRLTDRGAEVERALREHGEDAARRGSNRSSRPLSSAARSYPPQPYQPRA
jgi:FaeA-like protein